LEVDPAKFRANVRQVNGGLPVMEVSSKSGVGMDNWIDWLVNRGGAR
jgi:Ni2+-binding GTPase involved in maturation of urease and hydrogenase